MCLKICARVNLRIFLKTGYLLICPKVEEFLENKNAQSVRVYIIEMLKTITFHFLNTKKDFQILNVKSPYGMLFCDFWINNCPCSVKVCSLVIRSVDCKIEIVNSKENCFISFQIRRNKDTIIFLLLF